MTLNLERLLKPHSIAVIGGGAWCRAVIEQCRKIGFPGPIWPIHPKADEIAGLPTFRSLDELPQAPDASFVGVNRHATVEVINTLREKGGGGAVCFASGFREAQAEDQEADALQARLIAAAGEMPILGPNCYGFINYLDRAALWPDQHGGKEVTSGVALITQSSNIAINLTMQSRGLPLAYVVTVGNQAQCGLAQVAQTLLEDPRVTALGLHIEGFGDLRAFELLAAKAAELGKPIVALKVGRSEQARAATLSHTASLAGADAGASALLERLGIARVGDLPTFLETLKLLQIAGPLESTGIASISCSGGEASLAADLGQALGVTFPPLNSRQKQDLRDALGPMVALANPLDYHTYIWRDTKAMTRAFSAMVDPQLSLTMLIADFPRADRCDPSDWGCLVEAAIATRAQTGGPVAVTATLPELLPEEVAERLMRAQVIPFNGLSEALAACAAAATVRSPAAEPLLLPLDPEEGALVSEGEAKEMLARHGLRIPRAIRAGADEIEGLSPSIGYPQVLKAEGIAHKTEAGAIRLNLSDLSETLAAVQDMQADTYLMEEMITGTLAELLVAVLHDPAHGYLLTIGAGGTLTELLQDSQSLLLPTTASQIDAALDRLRIAPMLQGFRGAPPVNRPALLKAILAVQDFALAMADRLHEVEINPLICTVTDAIAADALLRLAPEKEST